MSGGGDLTQRDWDALVKDNMELCRRLTDVLVENAELRGIVTTLADAAQRAVDDWDYDATERLRRALRSYGYWAARQIVRAGEESPDDDDA